MNCKFILINLKSGDFVLSCAVMGKSTEVDGDNNPALSESDPAKLLEAALLQMDGIIAGECRYSKVLILNHSARDS